MYRRLVSPRVFELHGLGKVIYVLSRVAAQVRIQELEQSS